jgi:putative glutamine amidotransferase
MSRRPLRIGLSARIYHPQPGATGLQSKSLQYLEQSVAHWVMSRDVMVFMIPSVCGDGIVHRSSIRLSDYPQYLDGLVLQGGADISPQCYGEEPLHPTGPATACAMPTRWNCSTNSSKPASRCWASAAVRS